MRHISGHRLVALIEIISPGNKDRAEGVDDFAHKARAALEAGVNLLFVDLFPPGPSDPHGIHGAIIDHLSGLPPPEEDDPPADEPLTLAAYDAGPPVEAYIEQLAVGASIPEMPLFLRRGRYVNVPLEETYRAAYRGVPAFSRDVLEGRTDAPL